MKRSELKALYIKRMGELVARRGMSKCDALQSAHRPLIDEVESAHNSHMDASVHVGMIYRELLASGDYGKKKRGKK